MIKIVLISPILQPYRITFYDKLANNHKDYQMTVFHGVSRKEIGKPSYKGSTNFENIGFTEYRLEIHPFKLLYDPGMFKAFKRIDPDLLIINATPGNFSHRRIIGWARRKQKKIIIWTSGWDPGKAKGFLLSFKNQLVRSIFQKADFFLTYSTRANRYVESMGIDPSIIKTCYNGIETDELVKFTQEAINRSKEIIKKNNLTDHITFLFVGGLIPAKKIDFLVEAFLVLHKKYNKIKLLIIGDGPQRNMLEDKLKVNNNPGIIYLGRIIKGVDPYFIASDCFVLPGSGGLALNQAMFWKKPCIVSKADGTEDDLVIDNVTGYRFIKDDLDSLISAMEKRIIESKDKLDIITENAHRLIVSRNNVNSMVSVFSDTIKTLMNLQ